jgi:hypothetical protein
MQGIIASTVRRKPVQYSGESAMRFRRNYLGREGLNTDKRLLASHALMSIINYSGRSRFSRFLTPEGDGGGSGTGGSTTPPAGGQTPPAGDDKDKPDTGTKPEDKPEGDDPLATLTDAQKAALQKKLNDAAGKARQDGKEKGKAERDAELKREQEAADAKQKEKQGEFEKLYTELKPKYEALLQVEKDHTELAADFNKLIDGEVSEWPDSVRKTDPGKDNLAARRKWVEASRDLAKELMEHRKAPNGEHGKGSGGSGSGPKPVYKPSYRMPGKKTA